MRKPAAALVAVVVDLDGEGQALAGGFWPEQRVATTASASGPVWTSTRDLFDSGLSRNAMPSATDHQEREAVHPEDRLRLAIELAARAWSSTQCARQVGCSHAAASSSRRCRPVSVTKTSSRLACRVVRLASRVAACCRRSRRAGSATCGSADGQRVVFGFVSHRVTAGSPPSTPVQVDRWSVGDSPSIKANSTTCSPPSLAISSRRRAQRDDLAVVDDGHAVAQPLGLVHVVRRQEDRAALRSRKSRMMSQSCRRDCGSRPGRRLVEEQQLRVADQRAGDGQPLLLAAGELADAGVGLLLERRPGRWPRRASSPWR